MSWARHSSENDALMAAAAATTTTARVNAALWCVNRPISLQLLIERRVLIYDWLTTRRYSYPNSDRPATATSRIFVFLFLFEGWSHYDKSLSCAHDCLSRIRSALQFAATRLNYCLRTAPSVCLSVAVMPWGQKREGQLALSKKIFSKILKFKAKTLHSFCRKLWAKLYLRHTRAPLSEICTWRLRSENCYFLPDVPHSPRN